MNRFLWVALVFVALGPTANSAWAQKVIALDEYELHKVRVIMSKDPNFPKDVSPEGRKILARADLIVLTVDDSGSWRYRTKGGRELELPRTYRVADHQDLDVALEKSTVYKRYVAMRPVPGGPGAYWPSPNTLSMLLDAANDPGTTPELRAYVRADVGRYVAQLPADVLQRSLADKTHGEQLAAALTTYTGLNTKRISQIARGESPVDEFRRDNPALIGLRHLVQVEKENGAFSMVTPVTFTRQGPRLGKGVRLLQTEVHPGVVMYFKVDPRSGLRADEVLGSEAWKQAVEEGKVKVYVGEITKPSASLIEADNLKGAFDPLKSAS